MNSNDTISYETLFESSFDVFEQTLNDPNINFDNVIDNLNCCEHNKLDYLRILMNHIKNNADNNTDTNNNANRVFNKIHELSWINYDTVDDILNIFSQYDNAFGHILHFGTDEYINKKIINAFIQNNVSVFVDLLNDGFNPSTQNFNDSTIVHVLCEWKIIKHDVLELFLLHENFDLNIINNNRESILSLLCHDTMINDDAKYKMIVKILEHPNINFDNLTALVSACASKNMEIIKLLLSDKRIRMAINKNKLHNGNVLYFVISSYDMNILQLFYEISDTKSLPNSSIRQALSNFEASANHENVHDFEEKSNFLKFVFNNYADNTQHIYNALLIHSFCKGKKNLLKALLMIKDIKISFNYTASLTEDPTILYEILQMLKDDGRFNDTHIDNDGNTFYHKVIGESYYNENILINKLMLDWGMNPCIKNIQGQTVFHLVCYGGYYSTFVDLCTRYPNIDINMTNNFGDTLLHLACIGTSSNRNVSERLLLIKFLISHPQIDVAKISNNGNNVFHFAFTYPHLDIIKYLYAELCISDYHINSTNKDGCSPINLLTRRIKTCILNDVQKYVDILKYLLTIKRIDFLKPDINEQTPFQNIYQNKDTDNEYIELAKYMIKNIDGLIILPEYLKQCDPDIIKLYNELHS